MNHRLQQDWTEAGVIARAIVAKRVSALAGAGIILGELVRDRIIPTGLATSVTHWGTVGFAVLGVVTGVLWAQKATTPADPQLSPTDLYGNQLVSALSVGPHAGTTSTTTEALPATDALAAADAIHPMPPTTKPDPFMQGGNETAAPTTPEA